MTEQRPADWFPDPSGRNDLRYWNGQRWTDRVVAGGRQGIDPLTEGPPVPSESSSAKKVRRQLRRAGLDSGGRTGDGTLFSEPILVVNQRPKIIEVNAEHAVYNQDGQQIGTVREVGRSRLKNSVVRGASRTRRLQIIDHRGRMVMTLTRPASRLRSTVTLRDPDGVEIGQIVQKNLGILGKVRFNLEAGGQRLGSINAESWGAWDFSIQNPAGDEVARITRTAAGLSRQLSRKRDKYVAQINRALDEPLRSLVVSAALAVDTVLRQ